MTSDNDPARYFVLSAHDLSYLEDRCDIDASELASELQHFGPSELTGGSIPLLPPAAADPWKGPDEAQRPPDFQLLVGDPGLVVVTALEGGTIEVAQYKYLWTSAYQGVSVRRNGRVALVPSQWGTCRSRTELLLELIRTTAAERRRLFRRCRFCHERCPPEQMDNDVCHGCAQKHLGVVF